MLGRRLISAGGRTVSVCPIAYQPLISRDLDRGRRGSTGRRGHRQHNECIGSLPTMGALADPAGHRVVTDLILATLPSQTLATAALDGTGDGPRQNADAQSARASEARGFLTPSGRFSTAVSHAQDLTG